jgi:hypothetical protein
MARRLITRSISAVWPSLENLSHTNNLQSTHFTAHIPFMPRVSIHLSCHTHKCNKPLAVSHKGNIKVFMWWARAIEATKNCQFIILPAMAIFHILLLSSFLYFLYSSLPSPFRDSSRLTYAMHTRRKILKGEGNRFQYTQNEQLQTAKQAINLWIYLFSLHIAMFTFVFKFGIVFNFFPSFITFLGRI